LSFGFEGGEKHKRLLKKKIIPIFLKVRREAGYGRLKEDISSGLCNTF